MAGIEALHALVADHLPDDAEANQVLVGLETDRGPSQCSPAGGSDTSLAYRPPVQPH